MKVCPRCDREFDDDTQRFCLMDGTALIDGELAETMAMSGRRPADPTLVMADLPESRPTVLAPKPKKSKVPWIAAGVLAMLVLVAVSGWLLSVMIRRGEAVKANQNRAGQVKNSSTQTANTTTPVNAEPSRTAQPAAAESAPPSKEPDDTSEETTPIAWATAAATFNTEPGKTYKFECPPDGTALYVWGSDVYAGHSSICTAAVHAGLITLAKGGQVTIEFRPGKQIYGSTSRNGITSSPSGEYSSSFVFRKSGD